MPQYQPIDVIELALKAEKEQPRVLHFIRGIYSATASMNQFICITKVSTNQGSTYKSKVLAPYPTVVDRGSLKAIKGKLYAFGGFSSERLSAIMEYDHVFNQWKKLTDLPMGIEQHTIEIVNGRVFLLFGYLTNDGRSDKIFELI